MTRIEKALAILALTGTLSSGFLAVQNRGLKSQLIESKAQAEEAHMAIVELHKEAIELHTALEEAHGIIKSLHGKVKSLPKPKKDHCDLKDHKNGKGECK